MAAKQRVRALFTIATMEWLCSLLAHQTGFSVLASAPVAPGSPFGEAVGDADSAAQPIALGAAIGTDTLFIACAVLALLAIGAFANVIISRREARSVARLARSRAVGMRELLSTMRMAESIAGIGIWQYDPSTCVQHWSDGLKTLFGINPEEAFVEGDAETLLFANNIDLVSKIKEHEDERDPYSLKFNIYGYDGVERAIKVDACNLVGANGEVHRVVAVVRDITQQVEREKLLETSREKAVVEAKEARELAETDSLTGLANRRRVMAELDQNVLRARITQMPLVVVVFDIDHFKKVNDTHGHPVGDKVLQRISEIALQQARESDLIGRVGGEEFVWIIPGGSDGMARIMTERLRNAIALGSGAGDLPAVTVSVGYTALQAGDTALSLFARADSALYDAKYAGRNRVRMAA